MENLINNFTYYKNPNKPTYIDLILINKPRSFKNSSVLETGLSDFHKMTLTIMRAYFVKQTPKVVYYRDYKKFSNDLFRNDILQVQALTDTKVYVQTNIVDIFNEYAPLKKRYVHANQVPFMNKKLGKELMTRSRLKNKFLKTKTDANRKASNKQRNFCVSLFRREKKSFFFFNKFLFLFLSNLQTQLLNSKKKTKKHRNFLQETNK